MIIPTIKTLATYNYENKEIKLLFDFLEDSDSKFGNVEFQHKLESKNPFEIELGRSEIHQVDSGKYLIEFYEEYNKTATIAVTVICVLEYNGRVFELKESSYDQFEQEGQ